MRRRAFIAGVGVRTAVTNVDRVSRAAAVASMMRNQERLVSLRPRLPS
jgi:hypothetical protein